MIAAIHQPNYIPWLGYFYKMAKSDVFVILDNVQFSRRGLTHKNKIKSPDGELNVILPVYYQEGEGINSIRIKDNSDWRQTHLNYFKYNYTKAKHFDIYFEDLKQIYEKDWIYMYELNMEIIKYIMTKLGIEKPLIYASSLNPEGKSTELLLDLCKKTGADTYLSGMGGKKYMDESRFAAEGINLEFSEFKHPAYPQLWGDFIPNLSILDLLFNCGEASPEILMSGG